MKKEEIEKKVLEKFNDVFRNYETDLNNISRSSEIFSELAERLKILKKYLDSKEYKEMLEHFIDFSTKHPNTDEIITPKLRELTNRMINKAYN